MASSSDYSGSIFRKPRPAKVLRSTLNALIEMLRSTDSSLIKFGQEVSHHPAVLKPLMRAANSSLTGSAVEITEPAGRMNDRALEDSPFVQECLLQCFPVVTY